jgi:hypothetical protein
MLTTRSVGSIVPVGPDGLTLMSVGSVVFMMLERKGFGGMDNVCSNDIAPGFQFLPSACLNNLLKHGGKDIIAMKNIIHLPKCASCVHCKVKGFFVDLYEDGITCPCCSFTIGMWKDYEQYKHIIDNIKNDASYCDDCGIIFDTCFHSAVWSDLCILNAHFVKKWKDLRSGITYEEGMPCFDSVEDYIENIDHIHIIEWFCPHNGNICSKSQDIRKSDICKLNHM